MLGVKTQYTKGNVRQCPNIGVNGRKISGSAQAQKKGVVLQHGTFLVDVDLEKMFTFLKVSSKDACVNYTSLAKRKITSVANELGRQVSTSRVYEALIRGFGKALRIKLVEGALTKYELDLAAKLRKDKFATSEWNFEGKLGA
jgi:lipoate-protein ligase A